MFSLTYDDIKLKILRCGDGPASFNAKLTKRGGNIISVDPIYFFSIDQIRQRIYETYNNILDQTQKNQDKFIWKEICSVEELGKIRMSSMQKFLEDFSGGIIQRRYMPGKLPLLPFRGCLKIK